MAKYLNPFTDIGFKRIFGQEFSKPLLLDFLNNLVEGEKKIADLGALTKEERMKYDEGLRKYRDTLCVMEGAVMKGRAEGRAEGKAEGTELEKQATIQRLLAAGIDLNTIAIATGLPLQEVEKSAARLRRQ